MDIHQTLQSNRKAFDTYRDELLKWNEEFNLTAIKDPKEIEIKHFLDSLTLLSYIPTSSKTVVDIGSGAGFPGIPLAIVRPDLTITLIESIGKKAKFLEHIIETLSLSNVEVICARAEDVAKHPDYEQRFDVAVARAVAKLDKLSGYVLPLLHRGGIFLAQKGTLENLEESNDTLKANKGRLISIETITDPALPNRVIAVIEKI